MVPAKRVVIGCEASGTVRREFAALGHYVVSCDLRPSDDNVPSPFIGAYCAGGYHHQGDIFEFLDRFSAGYFDMAIYHPPCHKILQTGVRWIYRGGREENGVDIERWEALLEGAAFFKKLHEHPAAASACSENPKMSSYAQERIEPWKWAQHFQPYDFGHKELKDIYLWLRELPKLTYNHDLYVGPAPKYYEPDYPKWAKVHHMGKKKGVDRNLERSAFYPGVAREMALQWAGDAR